MSSDPRGTVPVLTVTGARWESELVAAVEHRPLGVVVVRRCVDLADLLATASSGTARAVLLSADLRRLDRDALAGEVIDQRQDAEAPAAHQRVSHEVERPA